MVPRKGLEPSRLLGHWHLKPARLPIPPPGHGAASYGSVARLSNCASGKQIGCTAENHWRIAKLLNLPLFGPCPARNLQTQEFTHGIEPRNPGHGLWRVRLSRQSRGSLALQ